MTEPAPKPPVAPRGKPPLYRTLLAVAVAALIAAWLPFSLLYINALSTHAVTTAKVATSLSAGTGQPGHSPTPVTTRVS